MALATSEAATKSDVLIALITAEGLLFAALSVSASIAGSSEFGPKTLGPDWLLSALAAVLLILIAFATVLAWADVFAGSSWSTSSDRVIEALGLLLAIVSQPVIATMIALGIIFS